jgi:hypothetical protein
MAGNEEIRTETFYAGRPGAEDHLKRAQLKRLETNRREVYLDVDLGVALDPAGPDIPLVDGIRLR